MYLYQKKKQQGIAIIYALAVMALFIMMLAWSSRYLVNSISDSTKEFKKAGMATNVAKAGAEDAYFWFTKQTLQPVNSAKMYSKYISTSPIPNIMSIYGGVSDFFSYPDSAFFPKYNQDPNFSETDDEEIGLVRDISISDTNNIWGHYEVKRQKSNNNDSSVNIVGMVPGNKNNYDQDAVHDISHLVSTQEMGSGNVWRIVSKGYVYKRNDFSKNLDGTFEKKYNEAPNTYMDQSKVSIDILRVGVNTSIAKSAIVIPNANNVTKCSSCDIKNISVLGANSYAVTSKEGSLSSSVSSAISGTPSSLKTDSNLAISTSSLFSITEADLRGIANQKIDSAANLSTGANGYIGDMSIIFADTNLEFTSDKPLKGGGLLYVNGNLTLKENSGSFFSGIIYVKGNVTIQGDNSVSGCIILENSNSTITLGGSNKAYLDYSSKVIEVVQKKLALYRTNNFSLRVYDSNK